MEDHPDAQFLAQSAEEKLKVKSVAAPTRFIPALAYSGLTRFYDPVVRWTTRESTIKARLVAQAGIRGGHRVLDVGCGTGTLAIAINQAAPGAAVFGLDADPDMLAQAAGKAEVAGASVSLIRGLATSLPFADGSFDRVVSSLFFHHLEREAKERTLREIHRVLCPQGELHFADWGRPANPIMRAAFLSVQLLDGFATTGDHVRGLLPALVAGCGFAEVVETHRYATLCGTLSLVRAARP